ncbi:MAG: amidohydrolase family protein, partial [Candidatus Thermoplasmatota archaeon]
MSLAIVDTHLLTCKGRTLGLIEEGAVGIEGEELVFVGKNSDIDENDYDEVIDGSHHVTMPGLIDAHIHTGLSLLRGAAQDVPEKEWMNKALKPIARHMDEEDHLAGSCLSVLEGLRSGTTTFSEFSRNVDRVIEEVYLPFDVRSACAETINEVVGKEGDMYELKSSEEKLEKNERLFEKYEDEDMVEPLYGPQALDMVTEETLDMIKKRAENKDRRIHMHV